MKVHTSTEPRRDRQLHSLASVPYAGRLGNFRWPRRPGLGALVLAGLFAMLASRGAHADTPSQVELAQLPRYCWGQYVKELAGKPGYSIQNCGYGMNHYCPALTVMLRANKPGISRQDKIGHLRVARKEIEYTLVRVTPNCPILGDVKLADQRLRIMEQSAGIKPPK